MSNENKQLEEYNKGVNELSNLIIDLADEKDLGDYLEGFCTRFVGTVACEYAKSGELDLVEDVMQTFTVNQDGKMMVITISEDVVSLADLYMTKGIMNIQEGAFYAIDSKKDNVED